MGLLLSSGPGLPDGLLPVGEAKIAEGFRTEFTNCPERAEMCRNVQKCAEMCRNVQKRAPGAQPALTALQSYRLQYRFIGNSLLTSEKMLLKNFILYI